MTDILKTKTQADGAPAAAATAPASLVLHAEPQAGGSYIRNQQTGALDKIAPAPATNTAQE